MAEISRKKPTRHLSGDSFETMFHQRAAGSDSSSSGDSADGGGLKQLLTQVPNAGSRRGGKRGGKKGSTSLGDFVEEMNSSFQAGVTFDHCEQTVDSREVMHKSPKHKNGSDADTPLRQPVRRTRSGRKPIKDIPEE